MKLHTKTIGQILGSLTTVAVMAAFATSAAGCNRTADESVMRETVITDSTVSGTTSANDPATQPKTLSNTGTVPPADATMNESGDTTTETKSKKTTTKKHHEKKHHKAHKDGAWNERRSNSVDDYAYEDNRALSREDDLIFGEDSYEDTVSGTTVGVSTSRIDDGGLSPFAQEPASRIPFQIGSGQITGKDKSVSTLEGASLFQEPSALERDRLNR